MPDATNPAATPAVQEPRVSDDKIVDRVILKLAGTPMGMSLEEWGKLANDLMEVAMSSKEKDATIASQAEALAAKEAEIERLRQDNETLTKHLDDCVEERLQEINAEAEAFDKECWNALRSVCESRPSFNWSDFNDSMTADDAAQFLYEDFRASDDAVAHYQKRRTTAEAALKAAREALRHAWEILQGMAVQDLPEDHPDRTLMNSLNTAADTWPILYGPIRAALSDMPKEEPRG